MHGDKVLGEAAEPAVAPVVESSVVRPPVPRLRMAADVTCGEYGWVLSDAGVPVAVPGRWFADPALADAAIQRLRSAAAEESCQVQVHRAVRGWRWQVLAGTDVLAVGMRPSARRELAQAAAERFVAVVAVAVPSRVLVIVSDADRRRARTAVVATATAAVGSVARDDERDGTPSDVPIAEPIADLERSLVGAAR